MADEKEFPKSDGDVLYAADVNKLSSVYDNFEQETLAVTTVSASASYSATRKTHLIKNIGTTTCYVNFDTTATTSDWKIIGGGTLSIDGDADAIHAITASGTTTLVIIGQS